MKNYQPTTSYEALRRDDTYGPLNWPIFPPGIKNPMLPFIIDQEKRRKERDDRLPMYDFPTESPKPDKDIVH